MLKYLFLPLTPFVCICLTSGQANELITDRPDQTESSSTVEKGAVQVETGLVFSRHVVEFFNTGPTEKTNDYASTLIRVGLLENVELRLITAYTTYDPGTPDKAKISGLQPLSVGAKFRFTEEKGPWPEIAVLGHLTLPWIGEKDFVPDFVAPDFRFSLSHTLSPRFSLGYNLGMYWDGFDARGNFIYTVAVGFSVVGPISVFAELFGEAPERLPWQHHVDFGCTILLTPDLQLDTSYGLPLSSGSNDRFFSAGLSFRFASRKVVSLD